MGRRTRRGTIPWRLRAIRLAAAARAAALALRDQLTDFARSVGRGVGDIGGAQHVHILSGIADGGDRFAGTAQIGLHGS